MNHETLFNLIRRDAVSIFSEETLHAKLCSGKPLTIKLGADPSRPDLHLGHSVVLRKLRLFQELGHKVVFVIGDYTGMIGDPSGRSKTRVPLTFEQTRENGRSYYEQVTRILDPEKTVITYNSEWLSKLSFEEVLKLAGKFTLAQILERDDFATRYSAKQPIGLHEMFYPLMQGYDSVVLGADIEVGGTDQTFNLLVGRELQRDYGQDAQEVITFPLLPGLDGFEKMSKSLDNYIGISESPESMFEKSMRVPDPLLGDYFRLTTDMEASAFEPSLASDIHQAHFIYARELVRIYHGDEAVNAAEERYREVAARNIPENIKTLTLHCDSDDSNAGIGIISILAQAGFAKSNSDARRLVEGKGIKINGDTITDPFMFLPAPSDIVISRGKNKFIRIQIR